MVQLALFVRTRLCAARRLQRLAKKIKQKNFERLVKAVLFFQKRTRERIAERKRLEHERWLYEQTWKYKWGQFKVRCTKLVTKPTLQLVYDGGGEIDQTFEKITISKLNMTDRYNAAHGNPSGLRTQILQLQISMLQKIGTAVQSVSVMQPLMDAYGLSKNNRVIERRILKRRLEDVFLEDDLDAYKYSIINNQTVLYRQGGIVNLRLTVGQEETLLFGQEQKRLRNLQQPAFTMVAFDLSQNYFMAHLQRIVPQHIFLWTLFGGGTMLLMSHYYYCYMYRNKLPYIHFNFRYATL
jgi:hypothetical protein